ncbi:1797_t:CDS:2, partial [Racocetra persica]
KQKEVGKEEAEADKEKQKEVGKEEAEVDKKKQKKVDKEGAAIDKGKQKEIVDITSDVNYQDFNVDDTKIIETLANTEIFLQHLLEPEKLEDQEEKSENN